MSRSVSQAVADLTAALAARGDPDRAAQERRYLKSQLGHLGVAVPTIRKVAVEHWRRHAGADPEAVLELAEALWQEPVHERRMCAAELLRLAASGLSAAHLVVLDRWAVDGDFWMRRAALLSLLLPLRHRAGEFARFGRYADAMLEEKEVFIRKAIGWVLREESKRDPEAVFHWLLPRANRASGLTLREASKYLPGAQHMRLRQPRSGQPSTR